MVMAAHVCSMDCTLPRNRGKAKSTWRIRCNRHSRSHYLGTDVYGRDMLSRTIYGARISIFGGLIIVVAAAMIGVPLGLWAGYREGISGAIITRVVELVLSFPAVLMAMGISIVTGAGFTTAVIALIIPGGPGIPVWCRGK